MRWILCGALLAIGGCGSSMTRTEQATQWAKDARDLAVDGQTTDAIDLFKKAINYQPTWTQVRFDLGRLQFVVGQRHFFDHLLLETETKAARGAGRIDEAEERAKESREKRELADPLLEEAASHLRVVLSSGSNKHLILNAHLFLGHTHALYEVWQEAKRHYAAAMDMVEPGTEPYRKASAGKDLMDEELDKQAEKDIGPAPG